MMQFQHFLMPVVPLFQHESRLREHVRPDQRIFNANVIPVLLRDCHGQVLTCSEWQRVESTVRSKLMLSLDDRPAKRPALGFGASASASSSASAATGSGRSHEHGESRNDFAQAFTSPSDNADEDDDVPIAARAPTHARAAASSSDTRERDVQISVLERENRALRLLLQSKDEKIKRQKKAIKLSLTKSWRNQKFVQRFKSTVESQLIQTNSSLGLEVSRVQTQKSTQKKINQLKFGKLEAYFKDAEEQHADADQLGHKPLVKGWLTVPGTIALGLRRNMSNCSAQDLGLVLMEDTCKSTVLRAECKVGAALIASSACSLSVGSMTCLTDRAGTQMHLCKAPLGLLSCVTEKMPRTTAKKWLLWSYMQRISLLTERLLQQESSVTRR